MNTKSFFLGAVVLFGLSLEVNAAITPSKPLRYEVGERGANHRVWNKVVAQTNQSGGVTLSTNLAYVELATGLHYQNAQGQFLDSKEEFTLVPGWAVARKGQHKVSLAYNLNTAGPVATELPDGRIMRSQVLSLHYLDSSTGQSVRLAEIKDCSGKVLPPNRVIYEDAFSGNVKADVRFSYTKSGIEQDVIIRRQLPTPESFGLNPDTTQLAVLTEFIDPPQPTIKPVERAVGGSVTNAVDEDVDFGPMRIGRGKAFSEGTNQVNNPLRRQVPVTKKWMQMNGRHFLLEKVSLPDVKTELDKLPKQASLSPKAARTLMAGRAVLPSRLPVTETRGVAATTPYPGPLIEVSLDIPEPRLVLSELPGGTFGGKLPPKTGQWPVPPTTPPTTAPTMEVAQAWNEPAGFVLDYLQLNADEINFTFYGGTTYYVSGQLSLDGTTTLQGGAVIKYGNSDGLIYLDLSAGAFVCDTTPDNVAIFTAKDDNSVGQIIEGSSGNPSGAYGDWAALYAYGNATLHDVQFRYLNYVIWSPGTCTITNAQFINCVTVAAAPQIYCSLKNVLVSRCETVVMCNSGTLKAENATFHQLEVFSDGNVAGYLTNCLVVAVADINLYPLSVVSCVGLSSDVGVFRSFGTGSHYLPANSPYIDAGSGTGSGVGLQNYTTQVSQAVEGGSTVDIGYHYYPDDSDGDTDGLLDGWEIQYFGNLSQTPAGDYDGDGVSNLEEFQLGRNPTVGAVADTAGVTGFKVYTPLK